nr:NADH dehydrogenase subunit 3 [Artemidia motanka]
MHMHSDMVLCFGFVCLVVCVVCGVSLCTRGYTTMHSEVACYECGIWSGWMHHTSQVHPSMLVALWMMLWMDVAYPIFLPTLASVTTGIALCVCVVFGGVGGGLVLANGEIDVVLHV